MARDVQEQAREQLSALAGRPTVHGSPARHLEHDAALLERLLSTATHHQDSGGQLPDVTATDLGAALSLFEDMRLSLDKLETQIVVEARRRGMDWRQIARHRGLNSSQAASQRYQRLTTRLEEIRQGIR